MHTVRVRYPGRICLLGEHCDWAGGSSLTVPLPMGIDIRAEPARDGVTIKSELDGDLIEGHWSWDSPRPENGPLRFVPAAMAEMKAAGMTLRPAELWVRSNLPAGRGFSSSAAFTLGVLDAMARVGGACLAAGALVELAYAVEHSRLGIKCGRLDPAACAAGQPLVLNWVRGSDGQIEMTTKRIEPLGTLHLVVAAFDRPRDTQRILNTLNRHHSGPVQDADGDAVREAISEFASAAERGANALRNGNLQVLGDAMNRAQGVYEENLADRFASTRAPQLIQTVGALRNRGAMGAKFSGAGGDGSVVALFATENEARATCIWLEEGDLQAWYVPVGAT
jgi:mevalonate kinase